LPMPATMGMTIRGSDRSFKTGANVPARYNPGTRVTGWNLLGRRTGIQSSPVALTR
jgi:hypothetical protein